MGGPVLAVNESCLHIEDIIANTLPSLLPECAGPARFSTPHTLTAPLYIAAWGEACILSLLVKAALLEHTQSLQCQPQSVRVIAGPFEPAGS